MVIFWAMPYALPGGTKLTLATLKRTGFPDLIFHREVLAQQPHVKAAEMSVDCRHNMTVFRTDDGQLIVADRFHTIHSAGVADSIAEMVGDLV